MDSQDDTFFAAQSRRTFCLRACLTVSAAAIGGALPACGGGSPTAPDLLPSIPTISASVVNGSIPINVDAASPLNVVGGAALVQTSSGNFLVAHTTQDAFTALTAVCTHQGCTISEYQNQTYECPCHGSQFSTTGQVVRGPAASPLRQFTARFANGVLTIAP